MTADGVVGPESKGPLLRNRDYLLFIGGQSVSMVGTEVTVIVLPLVTIAVTGSAALAGAVTALAALPYPLFSLVAGALVDRWNRRTVMVVCDAVRAGAMLSIPLAYALGSLTIVHLAIVAFVTGTAFVFFNIAEIASFRQIVGEPALARATSNHEVAESTAGLGGPALGGAIVGAARTHAAGGAIAFLVDGASFVVSVVTLLFIRTPLDVEQRSARPHILAEIVDGVRFLWSHATIRTIALLGAALNLWFSPAYLAVIVLAQQELNQSATAIGLIFSVGGAMGICGALVAPLLQRRLRVGLVISGSLVTWALAMLLLPLAGSAVVLAVGWGLITFISPLYDVSQISYRLSLIPNRLQGRVNSSFRFTAWSIRPVSIAAGGLLISAFGAREVLWLLAAGMGLTALLAIASDLRNAR